MEGCSHKSHSLLPHLAEAHDLTLAEYAALHPKAATISEAALLAFEASVQNARRKSAVMATAMTVNLMGIEVPVDAAVAAEDCLELPAGHRWPTRGKAKAWNKRALIALARGRNAFVWGMPGTGKDHCPHVFSAKTRRPTLMVTFKPGVDLAPWFYTRSIGAEGTGWEYGHLWKGIVEGVLGRDGKRRAPLVVLSDVDRADSAQVEWFRILCDSMKGRILDPHGKMVDLFVDEFGNKVQFYSTANSCGTGDARGRMASSNPMDASIMDRLGRKIEAAYMHWDDESAILMSKYPELTERAPWIFSSSEKPQGQLGDATESLRKAIDAEEIYAEFTMRGLADVLDECTDILHFRGANAAVPSDLLKKGFKAWLDGLDADQHFIAKRLVDPHMKGGAFGTVDDDDDETVL
jgi:hypothetical protein